MLKLPRLPSRPRAAIARAVPWRDGGEGLRRRPAIANRSARASVNPPQDLRAFLSQGWGQFPFPLDHMRWIGLQESVVVWAPAKVNLFLEVLGKRPDGYHEIATLMLAIRRFDTLWLREDNAGDVRLACNRPDLSTGPDNLVIRAARLLKERTGCTRGCRIRLVKRIPLAAGLAGGSSDAAATLVGLNELWQLGLAPADLQSLGAELGSDVAFFFHTPAAWCTGRGEIVRPMVAQGTLDLVLLCPNFGCATADVYRGVEVPEQPLYDVRLRNAVTAGDVETIGRLLHNRLEQSAIKVAPRLRDLRQRIEALGPAGTLLSGSGSTLFALCRDADEAKRIAKELRREAGGEYEVFVTQSGEELFHRRPV